MKLIDVINYIDSDAIPNISNEYDYNFTPQSVWKIKMCFEDEECGVTCSIYNPILIPWYQCIVTGFQPAEENTLEVWLHYEPFITELLKGVIK